MSEFSVGDTVRKASDQHILKFHSVDIGDEGEIESFEDDEIATVDWDIDYKYTVFNSHVNDLELTSKGGQNEMEDLEAIAVVGDEDLKEKFQEIAEENGFSELLGVPATTQLYRITDKLVKRGVSNYKEVEWPDHVTIDPDEVLELPQDWEKAKKFVAQDFDESLELAGEEVEVDGKEFSIGCYNGHLDDLQNLVDGLHGLGVNEVEITEQGHSVDIDDLIELREFVEGK